MNFSARYLISILEKNGYFYRRSSGSHQLFYHPEKNKTVIVPIHGKKDLPKGTFYAILKQAGINKSDLV
jgi:predicted RNA binding protein YcfA (HicA-like mRNA interferase family)